MWLTMISHGVEISIAGGVEEMVREPLLVNDTLYYMVVGLLLYRAYNPLAGV